MLRSAPHSAISKGRPLSRPNSFTKQWIEDKAQNKLTTALSVNLGRPMRIAITVDPSLELVGRKKKKNPRSRAGYSDPTWPHYHEKKEDSVPRRGGLPRRRSSTHLNRSSPSIPSLSAPVRSFRARRRANRVRSLRQRLQPLFIYGDSGLGKDTAAIASVQRAR